jgi:hypothetical protein
MIEMVIEELILALALVGWRGIEITEISIKLPNGDLVIAR